MELSIIFVNWNALDYLQDCIASILEKTRDLSFEMIVVDNASSRGDIGTLAALFPDVQIIQNKENVGFARANNIGARYSSGDVLLFLNPDIKLVNSAIQILFESVKILPDVGVVGCKLLNADLSVQTSAISRFPTILNEILDFEYLRTRLPNSRLWGIGPLFSDGAVTSMVEVVSGACMMIRREVFEKVGGFSEDYFMYAEDVDLSYRVMSAGFCNHYVGKAVMIHYGGRSSAQQRVSQWATTMKCRAMLKYYVKTHGRIYACMYRTMIGCVALGRLFLLSLVFPIGNVFFDRKRIGYASEKWKTVLKWALGLDRWAAGSGS